ncbi:MAG: ABC transporter substrate-binding protein [Winogradskyella sp.]|nr:ABC transporter substrate-binding protein [Winogradskyella sp.]
MTKRIYVFIVVALSVSFLGGAQNFSTLWEAHYSYNNVVDVVSTDEYLYAASENAIFIYDSFNDDISTITTVQGLSGQQISTISYSATYNYLIIGYENGLIELYDESDNSVLTVVDILDKVNITPDNKRINHFFEYNGLVYISTDYGISIYDLDRLEFGDTYFIGNGGAQISVRQVSILNDEIFAACQNNNGLKKADVLNPNLIDFQQWQTVLSGNFVTVNAINNKIYTVRTDNQMIEIDGAQNTTVYSFNATPLDSEISNSNIVYTTSSASFVFNEEITLLNTFVANSEFSTSFNAATLISNNIYIATDNFGVLTTDVTTPDNYIEIRPNGPSENNIFKLNNNNGTVWATYGEYDEALNPFPLTSKGISIYHEEEWRNIPFDSLLGARELNEIAFNPFNPNETFISSFKDGLLEFNEFEPTILYDQNNSGLESLVLPNNPDFVGIRISASEFDANGLLWLMNSRVDRALKSYNPSTGSWQGYSFSDLIENPLSDEVGFFDMEIDRNGTKWIGSYSNGLIAYNENIPNEPLRNMNAADQNIQPFTRFTALAIDDRNQLWIGTTFGLRVLFNTTGFYNDPTPSLSQIIILEDGIPKELLEGQIITDIKVDGSNNKWIGTVDSGIFYFSSDGQNTIYHFTTESSPLPSNTINDISIDSNNGIIYIATTRGLLAFNAGGSAPQESLEEAFVYPNPVRPEYDLLGSNNLNDINKGIKVSGLTENVNIKITDVEGNLVAEAQSRINFRSSSNNYNFAIDGGTAIWNGKNMANQVVASGVYLILISDIDSFETKVLKVMIVR